jgi:hypothetical protein
MLVPSEAPCDTVYYTVSSSILFCTDNVTVRNGRVTFHLTGLVHSQLHHSGLPCTDWLGAGSVRHWIEPMFLRLCLQTPFGLKK